MHPVMSTNLMGQRARLINTLKEIIMADDFSIVKKYAAFTQTLSAHEQLGARILRDRSIPRSQLLQVHQDLHSSLFGWAAARSSQDLPSTLTLHVDHQSYSLMDTATGELLRNDHLLSVFTTQETRDLLEDEPQAEYPQTTYPLKHGDQFTSDYNFREDQAARNGSYNRHNDPTTINYRAHGEYVRRYQKTADERDPKFKEIVARLTNETSVQSISMDDVGDLEFVPSGTSPELYFPAIRINVNQGTLNLNTAMANTLRDEFDGNVPHYCEVSISKTRPIIVVRFSETYERGFVKVQRATEYNRGWTITATQALNKLAHRIYNEARGYSGPGVQAAAYDQVRESIFGRRRAFKVYGTPFWGVNVTDDIV